ncbi:TonB-dependent receptor [Fulvivirga sp. M361]|uniref:SusC/RagA family TonB-linked outer membrane protein n=1 Tax=Fulvivirga sp. M361 TaxID=2594266 RepID=UPI001179B714|nr:TonB-dependent receptor [Fulvivirga sp. M361]TRX60150.1 TonB-dependent receptor [Fulvivirga sp. M361]
MKNHLPNGLLREVIKMSRILFCVIFMQTFTASLLIAAESKAQAKSLYEIDVDISLVRASIPETFNQIEVITGFNFSYNSEIVNKDQKIFVGGKTNLGKLLEDISRQSNLKFKRVDENIHVYKKTGEEKPVEERIKRALEFEVSGQILDENGDGLPGATVLEKGTTNGTVTDSGGNFILSVSNENATLFISFVGYEEKEVAVSGRSRINISMVPDIASLQEIVVVGYGTQKKSDLTGSVSSVKPEEIQDLAVPSLDQAIQGRAAGVFVSRNNGAPGSGAEIFIRGAGSIQGTDPLWIIDGVRTAPGVNFNMNDVKTIEILKDASAAAIYGSAAANGVIIVTTKRGEEGTTKVSFNSYAGVSSPLGLPDPLNTEQYAEIKNEAYDLAGEPRIPAYADPDNLPTVSTDWIDELYGNGTIQNYDLSVTGGSVTSNFFISGSYFKEEGTYVGTDFERYSLRANSDFKIGKRIKVGESLFLNYSDRDPMNSSSRDWIRATPALPVFNPDNRFGGFGTVDRLEYQYEGGNPLASELRTEESNKNYRVGGNVYLDIEIIDGLSVRTNLGANFSFKNDRTFTNTYLGGGGVLITSASVLQEYDENIRLLGNSVISYDKQINKHQFKILAGYEAIKTNIERYSASGANFTGGLDVIDGSDPDSRNATGRNFTDRILSQFGRINYSYNDTYLFTVNIRRDGSSFFGEEERYGVFPSASVGWRIINESFMDQFAFLSDLKLRASYGILGNSSGLDRYLYEASYTNSGTLYTFGDGQNIATGLRPSRFANQAIKWEEIETYNLGLDIALLESKLNFTVDYYVKNTNDLLLSVGLPPSAGYLQQAWYNRPLNPIVNVGQIQNKGLEMALSFRERVNDNFSFNVSANASYNENEVTKLNEDERIVSGRWDGGNGNVSVTEVGRPLGSFYGFIVDGIIQSDAELAALNNGAPDGAYINRNTGPGDFRYRDIGRFDENGDFVAEPDGEITGADRTFIGNPWPKWVYGLNAGAKFKNFDLALFFQGVQGVDRFNSFKSITHNLESDYSMTTDALNRWTAESPNNEQPRIILNDPNGNRARVSSYYVEDGSYLRLKNVQLGYTLPNTLVQGLTSLRLYGSIQNLLTITGYEGFDPEFDRGGNADKGIDRGGYPQSRIYTLGLQLDF